ncbi:MAG: isochorismatase family protein [Alphaproteobacteria bacterium]|nr:isochorismatase family protein [Alphaproteobacteria bacterium]
MSGNDPADDAYAALLGFYRQRGYRYRVGMGQRPAIVVVDFSYGFTASTDDFPGGEFAVEMAATRRLLDAMRGRFPVVFTTIAYDEPARDGGLWARKVPWLLRFARNAKSVAIDDRLGHHADDHLVVKPFPSAFHATGLDALLRARQVDTLLIAGCTTSVCVRATALDAMQHGYRAIVAREAVGDFNPQVHEVNLLDLDSRYADVLPIVEILAHLDGLARKE